MSEAAAEPGFARLLSDERLTRRAVGGDERAFAAIFRRYHQSLYRFCLVIVGNPEDAQDALQNTMMKVLRALPGEERKIELKPWLYRISHNESVDLLRRRRETRELDVEQIAPGYGLAEDAVTRERLRRLIADLKELPERQREVLVMRELSGLDFDEIGAALDTTGAVARQTLYEARQSLRQMEGGREMSCASVAKALSDGDGRVTRRRDVRAHLRACPECRAFRDEINGRQHDLAALSPLPAVAAAGMLHGLLGSSQVATGAGLAATLGGGAAKTISASVVAKGVATVAVVTAIGVTAADQTGVIHLGLPGDQGSKSTRQAPAQGSGSAGGRVGSAAANAAGAAGQAGSKASTKAGGTGAGAEHRAARADSHAHHAGSQAAAGDHRSGHRHENHGPPQSTKGEETAVAHQPPPHEPGSGNSGGKAATPPQPSTPAPAPPAPSSPPKEAPLTAPSATPEAQTKPSSPEERTTPEAAAGAGKTAENIP